MQMVAIIGYTHPKSFPEVLHHCAQHISWNYGDFFSYRLLKLFQSLKPMFVDFTFEVAPQKNRRGQIRGARRPLNFACNEIKCPGNSPCKMTWERRVM